MTHPQRGFFLIEVVIATGIIALVLIFLINSINDSVVVSRNALGRTQASFLLEEGAEAVRTVRSAGWNNMTNLSAGTTYYPHWNGSTWTLSTTSETVGIFTRTVTVATVTRDTNYDIGPPGGTLDTGTYKITVTVSWQASSGAQQDTMSFYLSDIYS